MIRARAACTLVMALALAAGSIHAAGGRASIAQADLEDWLTYIASDELQGRSVFTEGLGRASGYIQAHLQSWGLEPSGDHHGYLQTVQVQSVKATRHSSVTVRAKNKSRTFDDGDGVTFPANAGGKRTFTISDVEFAGYGLNLPPASRVDLNGRSAEGGAVIFLGLDGPKTVVPETARRLLAGRGRYLVDGLRAAATIGPEPPARRTGTTRISDAPDFVTTARLDLATAPILSAGDAFFDFLFDNAPVQYGDLKRKAAAREPLPAFRLDDVSITFRVDADYTVTRTELTENIVATVVGTDPRLTSTYVAVGAHYDHIGYADTELRADGTRPRAPGRVTSGASEDRIWNGADDDGSGTVAMMALARAFAEGPKPKRSVLFVWHAGEERGLYGSRYFADHPVVPLDRIVAQLNIDMVGRNRDDKPSESNTLYLVGSDRISTELHEVNREANRALTPPFNLDYEMNDPADPEQFYYRSDHFSYAAKGIPIIFFTTGLHPDYHANTDEVSKIEFPKLTRITELVYETLWRLANLDHAPVRDRLGPRAGKGTSS